ncbi:hypothetical protein VTN00DRAFT_6479 [Thermoascus crustaceus]|uniref:uncharacterized protein n=1 Tax=Thermoascus crustaceus TaxID=5088 RepID=UPI0037431A85
MPIFWDIHIGPVTQTLVYGPPFTAAALLATGLGHALRTFQAVHPGTGTQRGQAHWQDVRSGTMDPSSFSVGAGRQSRRPLLSSPLLLPKRVSEHDGQKIPPSCL